MVLQTDMVDVKKLKETYTVINATPADRHCKKIFLISLKDLGGF